MIWRAMSIGPTCRAAFHLRRLLGDKVIRGVFDWQVTPTTAFAAYLERDFDGLFDLRDLRAEGGRVVNRRFATSFEHYFPKDCATPDMLAYYGSAKDMHDRRCARTRAAFIGREPLRLFLSDPVSRGELALLTAALRRYSPTLEFELVPAPPDGMDGPSWKGNSAAWERHIRTVPKIRPISELPPSQVPVPLDTAPM